jgi:hypothetical protein
VVDRLPDPDLAWRAMLRFLAGWPQVAAQVRTATALALSDDLRSEDRLDLPEDVWALLGIDPAWIGDQAIASGARWLGTGLLMPGKLRQPGTGRDRPPRR